jgi:hypothetical protein
MQIKSDYPPSISSRQQLTPAPSVDEEPNRRSLSDSREDDYYFYHKGGMSSRRGSIQSIVSRPDDEQKAQPSVTLPSINTLFATVERTPSALTEIAQYPSPREPQNPQFTAPQPYYSPPTTYPHVGYRRPSIFSTYAAQNTSAPRTVTYPSGPPPPGISPYRTPSPPSFRPYPPPYQRLHPRPPYVPAAPQPPPTFAASHRTNSASPAERYMCHECNKSFSRPSSLRIHTFSHTGEKPFVCPEPGCTKRFSVRSNMRRHMKVHSEVEGESTKDDEGSERSASPGQNVPIRPRQGSRSSI